MKISKKSLLGSLLGLVLMSHGSAAVMGLNSFDMSRQFLGFASGGDGSERYQAVTAAMADKALFDARNAGARFVRISASGFHPSFAGDHGDLELWLNQPAVHWARMDQMVAALDRHGLKAVFTLLWNLRQFPAMTGESVRDLVTNQNSKSARLAERYVAEFVQRYRSRRVVLFYEVANELNLSADLDSKARCLKNKQAARCAQEGNYSTAEMISFCRRMQELIRANDRQALISSGYSVPRRAAEHIRAHPEWLDGHTDFSQDSPEQFEKNLLDIHAGFDIIGVHIYPNADNLRFGETDSRSTRTFEVVNEIARRAHKPLYVGEFGDAERQDGDPGSFTVRMLDRIAALKPAYSSLWVWEFYQTATYKTRDTPDSRFSQEPGFTDDTIRRYRKVSEALAERGEQETPRRSPEDTLPHVVLTWPLSCTVLKQDTPAYATASAADGVIASIEFRLDHKVLARTGTRPYRADLRLDQISRGPHTLKVVATDSSGKTAETQAVPFVVMADNGDGACTKTYPAP